LPVPSTPEPPALSNALNYLTKQAYRVWNSWCINSMHTAMCLQC